jgi:ATP-dependent RNA helicase RhlE
MHKQFVLFVELVANHTMNLKKINTGLSQSLTEAGLTKPNELQQETWSTIKSGVDCVIAAPDGEGKTTTIVINVVQRLEKEFEESPRAFIMVQDKAKVLEIQELFRKIGNHTNLRVYGVYEQGDMDYDKNQISLGIDVIVGTPGRLNDMFSTAGFDVNRLKMFIVDDANQILKLRHDTKIMRISNAITKTQRIFFTDEITERVETLADKIMVEPLFFEFEDEEDEYFEDEA